MKNKRKKYKRYIRKQIKRMLQEKIMEHKENFLSSLEKVSRGIYEA